MARMAQLMDSSGEIITDYQELMIEGLHAQLEVEREYGDIRFVQGQIAGIRDFCFVVKE